MSTLSTVDDVVYAQTDALKYKEISIDKISVVIPFFNNWSLTHLRLMELWKYVYIHEIILVDDASTDPKIDPAVAWWQKETSIPLVYIKNKENLGFGGSMNVGIWAATGDIVVLLSNDVVVTGDFGIQLRQVITPSVLVGNTLYNWDTGWNTFQMPGGKKTFPYLGGYFLAAHKQAFIELGGFDDRYGKFDFEDVDLSTTAIYMGYELLPLNSPYINHLSGQTVRKNYPDRERYTKENVNKFYKKWKKILYENTG